MNPVRKLLRCGALLWAGAATLFPHAAAPPPAGLNAVEWSGLRATFDAGRHRIAATAGGHQARNPGQHWRTHFDGQGFLVQPDGADWRWGLELTAYGFPGHEHTLPTGSATTLADVAGTRLDYAWDAGLSEWFVNDARGLEHGFTVHERPDDRQVLDYGDMSPLSLHHHWLTDAGQLPDLKEKRRPAGAVQDVDATATLPAIHYPRSTLNFHLAVRGDLRPVIEPDGRGVRFVDAHGTTRTTYSGLKVWDADGRILPAHFEPLDAGRPGEITLAVDERSARYPLTIDPIAQQAYLKASNSDAGDSDYFGWSVAVSGNTVVVGAIDEDSRATGVNGDQNDNNADASGAAYVFVRSGTTWTQQAYLKASNTGTFDGFGSSVAVSEDTVVVGAPGESSNATGINGDGDNNGARHSGAAYVFVRHDGVWTQQAYLKASNTGAGDAFGVSVAVSGDTVVVGAANEDSKATGVNGDGENDDLIGSGAAYIFVRRDDIWTQQAYIKPSNTDVSGSFGHSVAVSGDTVVVGAPTEDSDARGVNGNGSDLGDAFNSGAAYVFVRNGGTWTQQAYLKASNPGAEDYFSYSVGVSGETVVVGAPYEDSNATGINGNQDDNSAEYSGAAYVFTRSGAVWAQQAYLKAANAEAGDEFGFSLAVSGNTIVVGAPYEDGRTNGIAAGGNNGSKKLVGAAYLFARHDGVWGQHAYLKAFSPESGHSIAMSGATMAVGPPLGRVTVFDIPSQLVVEQLSGTTLVSGASGVKFGTVTVGKSTDLILTIKNTGSSDLIGLGVIIDGADANQFRVTTNPTASLAPGESTTFTVRFSPTSEGTKTAILHIASNDPDHNPFDLTLFGTPNVPTVASSGNDLTVSFVGTPGSRYRVQYLPGLTSPWTEFTPPALYTVPAHGVFSHTDLNPPDTLRLYRAVLAP